MDIDSTRRRKELADVKPDRDWTDVGVDKYSNIRVVPEKVPELGQQDELNAFDRILSEAPATKRLDDLRNELQIPGPTDFILEDEELDV